MLTAEEIIFIVWAVLIGGVIGSFMNVVVYRLPNGLSLIEPPSHCPKCKTPIRWYDNVPIIGWLKLRGKCRHCHAPISLRYPLVELTFALMFGLVMTFEYGLQGINLPSRETLVQADMSATNIISTSDRYLMVLYHLLLLSVLLCGALIEFDRNRPPKRMYVVTILIGLLFPFQWTLLRPMKAWPSEPALFAGGTEGLLGLAAGGLLGYIAWQIQGKRYSGGMPLGLVAVGVFLGWQAVLPIGITAAVFGVIAATVLPQKRQAWLIPASAWLWLLTLVWILFWAPLVRWLNLP